MVNRAVHNARQKKKMIDKAGALFWVKGYDSTSMREIARICKFEPSNVYNYFRSKEQLLFVVMSEGIKHLVSLIKDLENDTEHTPV